MSAVHKRALEVREVSKKLQRRAKVEKATEVDTKIGDLR